jgi:hypothetical protein
MKALQQRGTVYQPNYTAVLEIDYRNKWAFFQPIDKIQPDGTGPIGDATILGFETGVIF